MAKTALDDIFSLINEKEETKTAEQTKSAEDQMIDTILAESDLTDDEKTALLSLEDKEDETETETEEQGEKKDEKTASEAEEKRAEELGKIMGKVAGEEFVKTIEALLEKESEEASKVDDSVQKGTGEGPDVKQEIKDKGGPVDKIKAKLNMDPSAPVKSNALKEVVKKVLQTAEKVKHENREAPHDG